ncbi:cytochrome P450 [Streptomyces sp. NPDC086783]|uniref:cytochrome P450 n=1 Tax=Streptomyces sp. NPDC086783 TaxID=3365758 RepID=UPI00380BB863
MVNMDPPDHTRLRFLLSKAFTPRAVARLETAIQQRAQDLVAAVAGQKECDFAKDIAADLPVATLADVLGVPASDRWLLYDWSNRVIGYQDAEVAASDAVDASSATDMARRALAVRPHPDACGRMPNPRAQGGMPDLYAYARELGSYKRRHPGSDLMSLLVQAVDDQGSRLSSEEFEQIFWMLSVAGNETLRNSIPGGLYALLTHPEEFRRLREDRSLLPAAVEEMLRWWTPVMTFRRTAVADTELGGLIIRAGEKVVVYFSSANRDEQIFHNANAFNIGRAPNEHLALGYGPHFCIGAQLARMQMRAMFTAVLDRLDDVELAGNPVRLRSNYQNGIKSLPIRWRVKVSRYAGDSYKTGAAS